MEPLRQVVSPLGYLLKQICGVVIDPNLQSQNMVNCKLPESRWAFAAKKGGIFWLPQPQNPTAEAAEYSRRSHFSPIRALEMLESRLFFLNGIFLGLELRLRALH